MASTMFISIPGTTVPENSYSSLLMNPGFANYMITHLTIHIVYWVAYGSAAGRCFGGVRFSVVHPTTGLQMTSWLTAVNGQGDKTISTPFPNAWTTIYAHSSPVLGDVQNFGTMYEINEDFDVDVLTTDTVSWYLIVTNTLLKGTTATCGVVYMGEVTINYRDMRTPTVLRQEKSFLSFDDPIG